MCPAMPKLTRIIATDRRVFLLELASLTRCAGHGADGCKRAIPGDGGVVTP